MSTGWNSASREPSKVFAEDTCRSNGRVTQERVFVESGEAALGGCD